MDDDDRRCSYSALTVVGFGVLACNSALAVYRSWGVDDARSDVAFVLAADAALLLLFLCLSLRESDFDRAGGAIRGRRRRRSVAVTVAAWSLTALLTGMFASRVAPLMPPVASAVVWATAAATVAGGFWILFLSPP